MLTDQQHPITPPPELVEQWYRDSPEDDEQCYIATQAANWGADQELEACCEWLDFSPKRFSAELRAARRPKPPSLAEQAIAELQSHRTELRSLGRGFYSPAIDAALERLQQLEQENND